MTRASGLHPKASSGPREDCPSAPHANYSTSIALIAFREANVNHRYDRAIKAGQDFLKTMQWDETEGKTREDAFYGVRGLWRGE